MSAAELLIPGLDLSDELGRGAYSVVYRAEREGRCCAVKLPLNDADDPHREAVARLFDPRPPPESGRAPLDLAVAKHLVRQAGGDLRAEVAQPRGNRFVFELRVHGRRAADQRSPTARRRALRRMKTIER